MGQILDRAGKLAADGRLQDSIKLLEEANSNFQSTEGKTAPSVVEMLIQASARLRGHHPAVASKLAREAVARDPEIVTGWVMLSGLCDRLGELKDAKEACLKVVHSPNATPEQVLAASNLLVRYKEDKIAAETATKAFDELGQPLNWASALMYIAQKVADWDLVDKLAVQLRQAHKDGLTKEARESPRTNLLWCDDEAMNIAVLKEWSITAMPGDLGNPPPATPLNGRRLRVGYLSSDFRDHPTSRLINGLLRHHNHEKLELFMYDSGWDDKSPLRAEVVSHFDHVHSVADLSDEASAKLIRAHGVDVLVELNGPTRANRMGILKHWPAPVQIDYLGWPGSVGGRVVDYVFGDSYCVPPGAEELYAEKVIRLHKTYQVNDYAALTVPEAPTRQKLGLPEGVPVIGMFNAINKVHNEVWAVWMKIMKAVPDAVFWILDPGPVARKNIAAACKKHGINPKRVIAAPPVKQEPHLARLQACDIMVDPWPYGGHTSTSDALFAGVPVVAVAGTNFASRVSGGLLRAAGMEALVQPTLEGYVKVAVKLLRDPVELARIKAFIKENIKQTDVFDARSKARQMETAYRDAYMRVLEGKPPRHMTFRPPVKAADAAEAADASATTAAATKESGVVAELPSARRAATAPDAGRVPLVLVCGPWSSGTSAVAGLLANAGLPAPGPYVSVNDPRTPATYEMRAFQLVLKSLASEQTMKLTATPQQIVQALRKFRDGPLREALAALGSEAAARPVMLKHALTALMLPQICEVFDTRIVSVIRPLPAIEATRQRRRWQANMGAAGARVVYRHMFEHLVSEETPFMTLRYADMLAKPEATLDALAAFCSLPLDEAHRAKALAFVARPKDADSAGAPAAARA
jgi:predicted O-linked N-acetylglucosamine transferase (SPINDLY family)